MVARNYMKLLLIGEVNLVTKGNELIFKIGKYFASLEIQNKYACICIFRIRPNFNKIVAEELST